MTRRLKLALVGIIFALLFIFTGTNIVRTMTAPAIESDPGWTAAQVENRLVVRALSPEASAAQMKAGDEIVAINGQPVKDAAQLIKQLQEVQPGDRYSIVVRRGNQFQELALQASALPPSSRLLYTARIIITGIFLITGFTVFLLKPYDKQAVLLALMFGMFIAATAAWFPNFSGLSQWVVWPLVAAHVAALMFWPIFFHFFLIFPEPSPLLRRYPRLEFYLYLPHLLTLFPFLAAVNVLEAISPQLSARFRESFGPLAVFGFVLGVLYIAAGLLSLLVNYRQARRPARRKMRIVVAGSIAGFLPMFLVGVLAFLTGPYETNSTFLRWAGVTALLSFPLFPLSFAYAIIRHQVIPVHLILRRGVRYLLVSRGFVIIQALVVFGVLSFILTGSRMAWIDALGNRADIIVTILATALAIGLLTFVNQRVMPIIDRRYFREAYDAQELLSELGQEMRTVTSVDQLLRIAVTRVQYALHSEDVTIFLEDTASGDYICAISSHLSEDSLISDQADQRLSLPGNGYIVERLTQSPLPLTINPGSQQPPSHGMAVSKLSDKERKTLNRYKSALLLPIATKDRLLGVISLGPRLGDLPFSREDRQLLMAVAWQTAFAIQNAQLVQEVAEEERLRHELQIATAVQRRLFPQETPQIGQLQLSGVCHPARGVGGDYYDFIELDRGKVGIAVADVAGKGISAALLMSIVQASLRSQAPSVNGNLTELVSSMNRLLHVSTDLSAYATFFYAQFDVETSTLTYVNAGHNPPILLRAQTARKLQGRSQAAATARDARSFASGPESSISCEGISLLTTGGTVIGAFQSCPYEQEVVRLNAGDMVVAYTDGVTEAINASGEEFGEHRLRQLVAQSAELSAEELSAKIVEAVRHWARDTQQHDDLTLVVMKVGSS